MLQVNAENGKLVIHQKAITNFQEQGPANIKWGDASAKYAVESVAIFPTMEKSKAHFKIGGKGLIISFLSIYGSMFVMGVSHRKYDNSHKIVNNASCITNCLVLPATVIHDNFGIMERLMTTVDAIAAP